MNRMVRASRSHLGFQVRSVTLENSKWSGNLSISPNVRFAAVTLHSCNSTTLASTQVITGRALFVLRCSNNMGYWQFAVGCVCVWLLLRQAVAESTNFGQLASEDASSEDRHVTELADGMGRSMNGSDGAVVIVPLPVISTRYPMLTQILKDRSCQIETDTRVHKRRWVNA